VRNKRGRELFQKPDQNPRKERVPEAFQEKCCKDSAIFFSVSRTDGEERSRDSEKGHEGRRRSLPRGALVFPENDVPDPVIPQWPRTRARRRSGEVFSGERLVTP